MLSLSLVAPAAALNPNRPADSYSIRGWLSEHGLPSDKIRGVTQTRDGYLWLATAQGIARFDGNRFTVFTAKTNPELRGGGFFAALQAPDGTLWFGGDNGLFRWRNGHFDHFTTEHGLAHNYVRALALTRDGAVVACTRTGYSIMRDGRITTPGGVWKQAVGVTRSFLERADGTILLGTDEGLWRISGETIERLSGTPELRGNIFTGLLETPDGSLWIGYSRGVRCMHPDGRREDFGPTEGLANPGVSSFHMDKDGNLWIATYGGGLYRLSRGRIEAARYPVQLGGILIQQLNESREGALWVATATGLFRLTDSMSSSIGTASGLAHTSVYSVLEASDGVWWIGLWGGGVYRYDQTRALQLTVPASPSIDRVISLAEAPAGTLWIGALSGLYRHAGDTTVNLYQSAQASIWRRQMAEKPDTVFPGIAHGHVNGIAPDGVDGLWVATDGALYHGREGAFRAYTKADGLPGNTFKSVIRARNGDIWTTAPPNGVACLHDGQWTNYLCGKAISDVFPRAVYEDTAGAIWVTTEGGGLNRFKDGRWRIFTSRDGLADDFISGITEDNSGNFWIACPRGIMRIPREQFDELDAGRRAALQPRIFNRSDGLPAAETNQHGSPNALRARDGRLLFATDCGVAVIEPGEVTVDPLVPSMHIERLVINGADADFSRPVAVPPGNNDVQVHYTAISLVAPEKVRFKIRLAPLDRDWAETGGRRDVRYAKLPPGNYTFHAIACNSDGVWSEQGVQVAFMVRPFFYRTGWFIGLMVAIAGATVGGIIRARVRRVQRRAEQLRHQNEELERLVAERTAELAKSNETIRSSEYFYHSLVESLPQIIARKDAEGRFTYANPAFGELVGLPGEQIVGQYDRDVYPPEQAAKVRADDVRVMESGQVLEYENVVERPGQKKRYLQVKKVPLYAERRPIGVLVLFWDMTVFRETEELLRHAQQELIETSRLAGIAEVATGVLHNLGNALNSVNTSAALAADRLRKSKVPGVGKVAQLLLAQGDRLVEFFATDPRGRQLPGYLEQLAAVLQAEQSESVRELEALQDSVDHIKQIVAAQQSYAHVSGIVEVVPSAELVEFALRISEASLARHGVTVVREFSPAPAVQVERHKVLQILLNLIRNAKEAINESRRPDKQLVLGVRASPEGRAQIYVTDNGSGIAPENLTTVFNFGFTTKVNGHGFGLHTSANAAKEMGGSLVARSDGPGQGATFLLELPPAG